MSEGLIPITIEVEGEKKVIGSGTVDEHGIFDGVIDDAEYTGQFRGVVYGFSIIPSTFRSADNGQVSD